MKKRKLEELGRLDAEAFRQLDKTPLALVLDNIRSGLNVGSAFRTADAFALEKIWLCGISVQPPHREVLKTAIGAEATMDWAYEPDIRTLLHSLREEGYALVGVEQTDESVPLQAFRMPEDRPVALIFGNEVQGLSEEALPLLDTALEVPQYGTKHSLNVSVCLGIVVWELFRQWRYGQG